jgi:hypothetical protein
MHLQIRDGDHRQMLIPHKFIYTWIAVVLAAKQLIKPRFLNFTLYTQIMPQDKNRQFLEFEKPIRDLFDEIEKLKQTAEKTKVDLSDSIKKLQDQVIEKRREITQHLTAWQKVQLSRHPDRPYTLKYIEKMCDHFVELFGDRNVKDDKAMIGGFAQLNGQTVMMIGQQKGTNTKMRQMRNFGMANPRISQSPSIDETGRKIQ